VSGTPDKTGEATIQGYGKTDLMYLRRMAVYDFFLKSVRGKKVLEVGFADGYGAYCLANEAREVTGIEASVSLVELARATFVRENLYFLKGSPASLPFHDGTFDMVVSAHTLEHVNGYMKFLNETRRVLKPGGEALLATHNRKAVLDNPYCFKEFSAREFESALGKVFSEAEVLGLTGSDRCAALAGGVGLAGKTFTRDILGIRRFMPRAVVVPLCKKFMELDWAGPGGPLPEDITVEDFHVSKDGISGALDLIGVCKK
jgi:SAM-dependent methyltransferase